MKKIIIPFLLCFGYLLAQSQDTTKIIHLMQKYLQDNSIETQYLLGTKDAKSKKDLQKAFKNLPYVEVYDLKGGKLKYPRETGKLIKSFFEPQKATIPMSVEHELEKGSILSRFIKCSDISGGSIPTDVMTTPEKYYVLLFWKKSPKKSTLAVLKKWNDYAKEYPKMKLILVNLD